MRASARLAAGLRLLPCAAEGRGRSLRCAFCWRAREIDDARRYNERLRVQGAFDAGAAPFCNSRSAACLKLNCHLRRERAFVFLASTRSLAFPIVP